jgi:hypothetical protein
VGDAVVEGIGVGGIAEQFVPLAIGIWLVMIVDRRP